MGKAHPTFTSRTARAVDSFVGEVVTRPQSLLAVSLACLGLVVTACDDDERRAASGAPLLASDPAEQLEFGRNVARVGGTSPPDVAGAALLAAYPESGETRPTAWFLLPQQKWQAAALGAQFATPPINGALVPIDREFIPAAGVDILSRVSARGYPKGKGLEAIVLGKAGTDVFVDLTDRKLKATAITAPSPSSLSEKLVPFHGGGAGKYSTNIVVASADHRDYALPAAAWSAYSGDTLVFVTGDGVPPATARILAQREKLRLEKPRIYVIGPETVIPAGVASQLAAHGEVKRVAGDSAAATSVALARYYDAETLFGWNLKKGPASVSLVNANDWGNAVGAWIFAGAGPQAPLLLTQSSDKLPPPVARYVEALGRSGEPSQAFVFGDRESISSRQLQQLDRALGARR
jgi:hypothetical protein